MTNRTVFLLGSGTSLPAGMPSTWNITHRILAGGKIFRHTDGNYYLNSTNEKPIDRHSNYVDTVREFLTILRRVLEDYYQPLATSQIHYENIYYLAQQVLDSETGEYDNPAIQSFVEVMSSETGYPHSRTMTSCDPFWTVQELALETTHYIRDVVWHLLSSRTGSLGYLQFLVEACHEAGAADIFTLNHDTILDAFFDENGIAIADGFGEPINGVRYWDQRTLRLGGCSRRLFKLHGAVNWFRLRPEGGSRFDDRLGIPLDGDFWHSRSPSGKLQRPLDGRPDFLIGTFNKILRYTDEVYFDLHHWFQSSLRTTTGLVVCGYGFSDKGINAQIANWMYSERTNKLCIVHPDPEDLRRNARGAIRNRWDDWHSEGRLRCLPTKVEDIRWSDVAEELR